MNPLTEERKLRPPLCKLPGVIIAIVFQRVSDADLGAVQSICVLVPVCYVNREDFVGFAQVQSPPGVDVVLSVRARTLLPVTGTIPINGVVSEAKTIQRGLRGFPIDCQVLSCKKTP